MATKANKSPTTPADVLKNSVQNLADTAVTRATSSVSQKLTGAAGRLNDYAAGGGNGSLMAAATGVQKLSEGKSPLAAALGAGASGLTSKVKEKAQGLGLVSGGQGDKLKVTNIIEQIDVGVPVDVAYDQWTRFTEFPTFMKKVENVDQQSDETLTWKAQIFWSHRSWEATIVDQVPDERIVWRSDGDKGYVDGTVTFHELAPQLTRIILVLEYHPQGFFEKTANLWRAQGRRARLELKHFQRHVMTQAVLSPEEGWRGEIRDGEVVYEPGESDDPDVPEGFAEPEDVDEDHTDEAEEAEDVDEPDEEETETDAPRRRTRARQNRAHAS